jgi:hypothetical protein
MYNLYVLKDPTTDEVKYVGYTNRPKIRLWEHIRDAKKNVKTHKSNWIRKVLLDGKSPIMEVVKSVSDLEQVKLEEINLIRDLKDKGFYLTNSTNGGDGGYNKKMKEDHPMRYWNKGRKMSDESVCIIQLIIKTINTDFI